MTGSSPCLRSVGSITATSAPPDHRDPPVPRSLHGRVCSRLPLRPFTSSFRADAVGPWTIEPSVEHRDTGVDEVSNRDRGHFYGCAYNHKRGAAVCSNDVQIRQDVLDLALLDAISRALDERIVEAAIDEALERLRSGREQQLDRRTQIERELSLIEGKQRYLVQGITRGESMDPLLAAMREEEHRKKFLVAALATLAELEKVASLDAERIKRELRSRAADIRGLLGRHLPQTRQILRKLVVGRVECEPFEDGDRPGYRVSGQGTYARLLPGGECATSIGGSNELRRVVAHSFTFEIRAIATAA